MATEVGQHQMCGQYYKSLMRFFFHLWRVGDYRIWFPRIHRDAMANPDATVFNIAGDGASR